MTPLMSFYAYDVSLMSRGGACLTYADLPAFIDPIKTNVCARLEVVCQETRLGLLLQIYLPFSLKTNECVARPSSEMHVFAEALDVHPALLKQALRFCNNLSRKLGLFRKVGVTCCKTVVV